MIHYIALIVFTDRLVEIEDYTLVDEGAEQQYGFKIDERDVNKVCTTYNICLNIYCYMVD